MPRLPKNPATRRRRNKSATAATLSVNGKGKTPPLPKGRKWRAETKAWWADVWASPMVAEFLQVDIHSLRRLAILVDEFWIAPSTSRGAEIRQQQAQFGLTPQDRARLGWKMGEEPKKPAQKYEEDGEDPRKKLRLMK